MLFKHFALLVFMSAVLAQTIVAVQSARSLKCQRQLVIYALSVCGVIDCKNDTPLWSCNPMPSEEEIKAFCCSDD
ncbi:hypothetical protein CAEBREN_21482 [Caenorhabditis brenneri]|uniref:Uncharacterized protein n=1 Tax=Caenorhabditis brenneri TaxID=135651 RepID=G0MJA3_CAEBE|nr:hypothetical protein CAEBREN_21482 [Caenorhabditis brenneri]